MEPVNFTDLAVYKKAMEIFKVSRAIACAVGNSGSLLELAYSPHYSHRMAGELVTDSLQLAPTLAAIQNSATSSLQLKRAEKIRRAARRLRIKCRKIEYSGIKEKEFLALLKNDIRQFEFLFSEWLNHLQLQNRNN